MDTKLSISIDDQESQQLPPLKIHPHSSIMNRDIRNKNRYFWINLIFLPISIAILPIRLLTFLFGLFLIFFMKVVLCLKGHKSLYNEDFNRKPIYDDKTFCDFCFKKFLSSCAFLGWRCLFFSFGVYWISVRNSKNLSKQAKFIVVGPHTTMMDGIAPSLTLGRSFGYTMTNASRLTILEALDFIFVDVSKKTSSKENKRNVVKTMIHRANSEDWDNYVHVMFPEGTTSNGTCMNHFQKGAFIAGKGFGWDYKFCTFVYFF